MKSIFFIAASLLFCLLLSCKKEISTVIKDPCENIYDLRSKLYSTIFKGSLHNNNCNIVTPRTIFPDKYSYYDICVNPNNEYEICYLRADNSINQSSVNADMYKFDFCTGKSALIAKNVAQGIDWSAKDWIIFNQGKQLLKIKSNGDSLILLTQAGTLQSNAKWSPDGSKYICNNGSTIVDENGKQVQKTPFIAYSYTWKDNITILYNIQQSVSSSAFEIKSYNINTQDINTEYSEDKNGAGIIYKLNPKYADIFVRIDKNGRWKIAKINTNTWLSTDLGTFEHSYNPISFTPIKDKAIYRLVLRDTITGKPCNENHRYYIAIMNLDGTNERQVILPE